MKNKIIRLKTAGVIALPTLGILLGFFSGVSAAQALMRQPEAMIIQCQHSVPQPRPVCIEPLETLKRRNNVHSNHLLPDVIEQKIDKAMKTPAAEPQRGLKNPVCSTKIECMEPLTCDE